MNPLKMLNQHCLFTSAPLAMILRQFTILQYTTFALFLKA